MKNHKVRWLICYTAAGFVFLYIEYLHLKMGFLPKQQKFKSSKIQKPCLKNEFSEVLLLITFNSPLYDHIPLLLNMYQGVFSNILFCGPKNSTSIYPIIDSITYKGYFSYDECAAQVMAIHPNYTGYLTFSDDVLLNVWNLKSINLSKLWQGPEFPYKFGKFDVSSEDNWHFWKSPFGLQSCVKVLQKVSSLNTYKHHINRLMESTNTYGKGLVMKSFDNYTCYGERSDIFYIPQHMAKDFIELSHMFKNENVFLEIAVPTIIRLLATDIVNLKGKYMPGDVGSDLVRRSDRLLLYYSLDLHFIHPFKFNYGEDSTAGLNFLRNNFTKMVNMSVLC